MPLDSKDAYVLSRIDGVTLAHEIVDACGLDARTATEVLNRLTAMGLIQWDDEAAASEVSEPPFDRPGGRVSGTRMSTKRNIEAVQGPTPQLLERFERLTHYQLLGLYSDCADYEIMLGHMRARNLDAGTLAFRMAARLGEERVLARVAAAYEVLRSSEGRRKYDEYLLYREETRAIEDALSEGVRRASLVPPPAESSAPVSKGDLSREGSAPPHLSAENITGDHLIAALREQAPRGARRKRVEGLVRDAIAEREADNLVGATNALRLANSILPDCNALEGALTTVTQEMNESLASTFRAQAMYEENLHMWEAAAETWEKVLLGQPGDARAARGAAQALLEAGGDLKRARRHAEEAVKSAPKDVECQRTLARVYIAAGMTKSAQRALNNAEALESEENNRRGFLSRVSARWRRE